MIQINAYGTCDANLLGSGQRNCVLETFGDLTGVALSNGLKFNVTTDTLNKDTWTNSIKDMNLFPYFSITDFTDNTTDNEVNTSTLGIAQTIRQGRPYFDLMYTKGGCTHKSLYDKRGFSRWDTILIFENGILMRQTIDGTEVRGFTTGDFAVETLRLQSGTDRQRTSTKFQLIYPDEFNAYHVFFTWEALGFSAMDVEGLVDVNLTFAQTPAEGDSTLYVKAVARCNTDDVILGLDDIDYWTIVSETVNATAITFNTATNNYEISLQNPLAEEDTFHVKLYQDGKDVIEDLSGSLYKGKTAQITIDGGISA